VVLSKEEYEGIQETLHLLSSLKCSRKTWMNITKEGARKRTNGSMKIMFLTNGWEGDLYWQKHDKKVLKK